MKKPVKPALTQRDTSVLKLVHDYGLVTTREIQGAVFKTVDHSTVMRRLRKLTRRGYLLCDRGFHLGPFIWTLASKGAKALGSDLIYGPVNRNQLEHETTLSALRAHMATIGVSELWQPGFLLRKQAGANEKSTEDVVIPDALMAVRRTNPNLGKGTLAILAIELELHAKAKRRYHKVFATYRKKKGVNFIWYIVPHSRFGEMLLTLWQECSNENEHQLFAWSLVENVFKTPSEIILNRVSGAKRLADLVMIKTMQASPAQSSAQSLGRVAQSQPSASDTQTMNTIHETNPSTSTTRTPSISDTATVQAHTHFHAEPK